MTFERPGLEKYDFSMEKVKWTIKTLILQKIQLRVRFLHFAKSEKMQWNIIFFAYKR